MATIKLRDYLLAISSKNTSAANSDKITILDSADSNAIKTILKEDLVDTEFIANQLRDDFLEQFGEGTVSQSSQIDHDSTTNFVANEHIDHSGVSILAGNGLTGGGTIDANRTIDVVSANNGISINLNNIELENTSTTFTSGVKLKLNTDGVVSSSAQIDADQTNGWVADVKTQLNSNTVVSASAQISMSGDISGSADSSTVTAIQGVSLTSDEVTQISNIDSVTISNTQWGYLGSSNQALATTDNVTFNTGSFTGNVTIAGNLDVLGDAVEIQTSELRIEDKLITVASGAADSTAANGAGLEIDGANKSLKWNHPTQQFVFDAKVSSSVGFFGNGRELTGIDTDQVTEAGNLYYTDGRVLTKINAEGVLSSSAQIATEISGAAFTSASNEFAELTLTKGSGTPSSTLDLSPNRVLEAVKNKESVTLPKGTPVYISGSVGNQAYVYAASASRADRMPAAYVLDQQLTADGEGYGIALGFINGVDTSTFDEGDEVYVGASGGYTNIKPTGNSNKIQKLGNVIKSAVNGSGVITGAGRSNDVPNIQEGFVWVGGTNDVPYQLATSSLLSGESVVSASSQIDVTATTNYSSINQYTDSDNTSHLNSLGVVSGSSQIDVTLTTNYGSINQYTDSDNLSYLNSLGVQSGSDTPHYTDSDNLSYLNSLLVVSKSAGGDLDVNGDITGSKLSISKDVDSQNFIGRAMIGNQNVGVGLTSDQATFSHIDHTDYQSYGFSQTNGGVTIINHPTTQYISFRNNNTEIARFDNTDYFGINTDNPLTRLHISGSTTIEDGDLDVSGNITGSVVKLNAAGADGLILGEDTANSTLSSRIFFMNNQTSGWAIHKAANHLEFKSGSIPNSSSGVAKLKIYSGTDNVEVTDGNLVIGTAGKGIDFSATSDGSGTSTSELLDDYEEGTWTGTLKGSTTDPSSAVTETGYYTKIGNQVTAQLAFTNVDTTGAAGSVTVTGLPYASNSNNNSHGAVMSKLFDFNGGTSLVALLGGSVSEISFLTSTDDADWNDLLHNAGTNRSLRFTLTYFV